MIKIDKRQLILLITIIVVSILCIIGLFAMAATGPFGLKMNWFEIIYQSCMVAWAFLKMFALMFWNIAFGSWLSTLVTFGLVLLFVLKYLYEKNENGDKGAGLT